MAFFGAAQGAFTGDSERARQAAERRRLAFAEQQEATRVSERRQDRAEEQRRYDAGVKRQDEQTTYGRSVAERDRVEEQRRYEAGVRRQDDATAWSRGMTEAEWNNKLSLQAENQRRHDNESAWSDVIKSQQMDAAALELEQRMIGLDRYRAAAEDEKRMRKTREAMQLDNLIGLVEAARLNPWGEDGTPVVPFAALQLFKGNMGMPIKGGWITGDIFYLDTGAVDQQGQPQFQQIHLPALQQMHNRMNPNFPVNWYPTDTNGKAGAKQKEIDPRSNDLHEAIAYYDARIKGLSSNDAEGLNYWQEERAKTMKHMTAKPPETLVNDVNWKGDENFTANAAKRTPPLSERETEKRARQQNKEAFNKRVEKTAANLATLPHEEVFAVLEEMINDMDSKGGEYTQQDREVMQAAVSKEFSRWRKERGVDYKALSRLNSLRQKLPAPASVWSYMAPPVGVPHVGGIR